jgi:hypothetical protein
MTDPSPSARALAEIERARRFLREIRDGIARHPRAARCSRIALHERRTDGTAVLRLSGTLDGVLVDLQVEIPDRDPLRPRLRYSGSLDRLRNAAVMGVAASAFAVAHDRAFGAHYGLEPMQAALRRARAQATAQGARLH